MSFTGSLVAIITPLKRDGSIDEEKFSELVNWHIESGSDGIVIGGTTGEGATLDDEELFRLFTIAKKESQNRIKLIGNTGCNNTMRSVEKTKMAQKIGLDGVMAIVPYYNKPTFRGCWAHFSAIAAVGLPLVIYYHPGRTGISFIGQELIDLCSIPGVCALKDCSSNLNLVKELINASVPVLCGDDPLWNEYAKLGSKGIISPVANIFPKEWKHLINLGLETRFEELDAQLTEWNSLLKALYFEINPQGIKYATSKLKETELVFRLPLVEPLDEVKAKIDEEMQNFQKNCKNVMVLA